MEVKQCDSAQEYKVSHVWDAYASNPRTQEGD